MRNRWQANVWYFVLDEWLKQLTDKQNCHSVNFLVLQGRSSCGSDVLHGWLNSACGDFLNTSSEVQNNEYCTEGASGDCSTLRCFLASLFFLHHWKTKLKMRLTLKVFCFFCKYAGWLWRRERLRLFRIQPSQIQSEATVAALRLLLTWYIIKIRKLKCHLRPE